MQRTIALNDALALDKPIFVDMRAPAEYADGHIPGAVSIPLFDDDERRIVGTIYHKNGPEEAKQQGLGIVSGKLPELVSRIRDLYQTGGTVVVYCWRGGMRSKSVVSVLELMGIPAYQLLGGYKGYRRYVLEALASFDLRPQVVSLCGSTGVGKTTILGLLKDADAAVIDLEKLANHRGSAFGQVGLGPPATAQNFDALLLNELFLLNDSPYILVECESKRIGNVYIPEVLFAAMKKGPRILTHASLETRVSRLMAEYLASFSPGEIRDSLMSLTKRLGAAKTDKLLAAFDAGEVADVVRSLLVDYYDPLYGYETAKDEEFAFKVDAEDFSQATAEIMSYLNTLRG